MSSDDLAPPSAATTSAATGRRCRNCGTCAPDAYCPNCGQETRERLPTVREFARETAGRYVAMDGTLWRTLAALLFRPGLLTREYLAGRRRHYVRPFRLYLATSLLCFLVIGIAAQRGSIAVFDAVPERPAATGGKGAPDAVVIPDDATIVLPEALKPAENVLNQRIRRFSRLPPSERVGQLESGTRHNAPYAMFVLVPAFALLLKLVYPRRKRRPLRPGLYGEHLVFAVHGHAFLFVAIVLATLLPQPFAWLCSAWAVLYFLRALSAVYGGTWFGTFVRAGALLLAYAPLVAITAVMLIVATVVLG